MHCALSDTRILKPEESNLLYGLLMASCQKFVESLLCMTSTVVFSLLVMHTRACWLGCFGLRMQAVHNHHSVIANMAHSQAHQPGFFGLSVQAVANVARVLKAGTGRVLVRDYAEGDLAQLRLSESTRTQRLSHNFYVRSDGTQAYYFSKVSSV